MDTKRSRHAIDDELRSILEANPNVDHVTKYDIYYTQEFKEEFWEEYSEEHTAPNTIFQRHGFDTERLGYWRAVGFTRNLVKAHRSEEAQTKESYSQKQQEDAAKHNDVQRLEHKVELLEQQLEYIKKTIELARKESRKR